MVSGKYDGALKAEHGTGRNMAPFVETEWGTEAYGIMRDLKSLLDPDGMLNPGVLINPNPRAHVTDVKTITPVSPIVDACIECGFCESKCPSRRLTLTPRQRIVVQREISRLEALGESAASLKKDYVYDGIETCAVDGLCASACPVSIDTGELTKQLRSESLKGEKVAGWIANNFGLVEKSVSLGVKLGHLISPRSTQRGAKEKPLLASAAEMIEKVTGATLPKWNNSIPHPSGKLPQGEAENAEKDYIYFPSCISRQLGQPAGDHRASLAETLITVSRRASINLIIPSDITGTCCGMPFSSKGYTSAYKETLHNTILKFWEWSEHGELPIVIDTTSCLHSLRNCKEALSKDDQAKYQQMPLLDSLEFIHDTLLSRLDIQLVNEDVVLHPNCSARKLGLDGTLLSIAKQCARSATVPINLECCAFAGDRGLLYPELTASATEKESAEVLTRDYGGYYSSNIPCEMGMSEATGQDYVGIVYLVERATR